jgi:hypothetical protein
MKETSLRRFDMDSWFRAFVDADAKIKVNLSKGTCELASHACGTAVCALGTATMIPEFRKAGLKLRATRVFPQGVPSYRKLTGYAAGAAFFGIAYDDARELFDPSLYDNTARSGEHDEDEGQQQITVKDVVGRLDALLNA